MDRHHPRHRTMRRFTVSAIGALAASAALAAAPTPASAGPPAPPAGVTDYGWKIAGCYATDKGPRKIARFKATLYQLPEVDPKAEYYLQVDLQLDRLAGVSGDSWRKVTKTSFKQKSFSSSYVLPVWTTPGTKTGLGHDAGTFTWKAIVRLRKKRLDSVGKGYTDKTFWKYEVRSPTFDCSAALGEGGSLPPAAAPPSANGGS